MYDYEYIYLQFLSLHASLVGSYIMSRPEGPDASPLALYLNKKYVAKLRSNPHPLHF